MGQIDFTELDWRWPSSSASRSGMASSKQWPTGRMGEILKTGKPVEDRTSPAFGGMETFIQSMRRGARAGAGGIAEAVLSRLPEGASILDVGGGPGTNAEALV